MSNNNPRSPRSSAEDLIGRVLNSRYELTACLSAAKLASVFRARPLAGGDDVAIKILHAGNTEADYAQRKRFHREAKAASLIEHPNVIKIYEAEDTPEGLTYFVMELLEGVTLWDLLRQGGPLPLHRTVEIFTPICEALHAAHLAGVVHRDVKPGNVFLQLVPSSQDSEPPTECIKVLDFGIAKPGTEVNLIWETSSTSGEGAVVGTPEYMSPEQCQGIEVTPRSDVYSLGAMLYRMLTGQAPFDGPTVAVLARHVNSPPPPLRLRRPNLPQAVENVVLRALAKLPGDRYASAVEFATAFTEAVEQHYNSSCDDLHPTVSPPEIEERALASQTLIMKSIDIPIPKTGETSPPKDSESL